MEQYYYESKSVPEYQTKPIAVAQAVGPFVPPPQQPLQYIQQPQPVVYHPQQQGIRITYCVNQSLNEFEYYLYNIKHSFLTGQSRHNLKPIRMGIFGEDIHKDVVSYSRIFSKYKYNITEAYMDVTKIKKNYAWGLIKSSEVSAYFVEMGRFKNKTLWNNKKVGDIYQKDHRDFSILDIKTEVKNFLGFSYNVYIISGTYVKTRFLKAQPRPVHTNNGGGGGGDGGG
jgi:hypothetical protein